MSTSATPQRTPELAPAVHCAILEDSAVVLDAEKGLYFSVNDSGAVILNGLQNRQPLAAICQQLVATFECTPKKAEEDVRDFLNTLQQAGLLRDQPDSPGNG